MTAVQAKPSSHQAIVGRSQAEYLTAIAGVVYVAAWIVGLIIGFSTSSPSPTDSTHAVTGYFLAHREASMVQAYLLDGIAGVTLLVFAAGLRNLLMPRDGENSVLGSVLFGAGIVAASISLIQGLFTQVLADRVASMNSPAAVRTLYDLNAEGDTYKLLALGLFLVATSLLARDRQSLPAWLCWAGIVLGPLLAIAGWNFVLSTSTQYAAYSVLLVFLLLWVIAASIMVLRRPELNRSSH